MAEVVHIAGPDLMLEGRYLRQRCAWCGALLLDYDLTRIAVPVGTDPTPATWPTLAMVAVDGPASWTVEYREGEPPPDGSCGRLDPAVTA